MYEAPRRVNGENKPETVLQILCLLESVSHAEWDRDRSLWLIHAHLSCLVAWQRHTSGACLRTKKEPSLPPPPPSTMLELIVDSLPSLEGLRSLYFTCAHPNVPSILPTDLINALERRLRWHEHHGEDSLVPFKEQAERIVGAFFLRPAPASPAAYEVFAKEFSVPRLHLSFGSARQLKFEHVTEFLRAMVKRGETNLAILPFLNFCQFRPVSWPIPRLRFKVGQIVWVSLAPEDWVRATVLHTNALLDGISHGGSSGIAAYIVHMHKTVLEGTAMWGQIMRIGEDEGCPITHDNDLFIRKKRPTEAPAPAPAPEDPRAASARHEAHDRREAMERARVFEAEWQRKARAKDERRRREEEEERQSLARAAQAAARAAAREPAPWPADMPLCGADASARARREAEKEEGLARVAEHRTNLREQEEESAREALRKMELRRVGDLIQRGDGE